MVFYLKYRPKKISELDSLAIQEKLGSVLKGKLPDDIPHAFLFTGPKGLGKTSTARIVSKSINCTNRKKGEIEPCNKCSSCKSIDAGSNLDVLEIDGASNRGIDEIRDLRDKIRLSPVNSKKKVYIIDEVHMLTTEAFNALLKTLEEPPSHAQFILCTTESQKIPETIASRCFNLRFTRANDEDLVNSFKRIVKGEGITADKDALFQIATLSDGSFRDGAKILEEISAGKNKISVSTIEKKYNFANVNKSTQDLISALISKDAKKAILIISKLSDDDTDFKYFTQKLINSLHEKLISEVESGSKDADGTRELITMLVRAHVSIKYALLPQLPLELTVVEWCSKDELNIKNHDSDSEDKMAKRSDVKTPNDPSLDEEKPQVQKSKNTTKSKNDNILESLIESVKKDNFSIAGVLRGCSVEKYDEQSLILSTEYKFHKERLSEKKVIDMLGNILKEISGKEKTVLVELKG